MSTPDLVLGNIGFLRVTKQTQLIVFGLFIKMLYSRSFIKQICTKFYKYILG